jgi:DNA repair photolyase
MSIIYEPKGKAREYSPLAASFYRGCNHGCKYCYVPPILYLTKEKFHSELEIRKNIQKQIDSDFKKNSGCEQVFFSFSTDPYNKLEETEKITQYALQKALEYKIPISILTKSKLVLRDLDIFKSFEKHIQVGMTLTFLSEKKSLEIEPKASTPNERIEVLKKLKENGIRTWASIEPVIEPEESIAIIKEVFDYVDTLKIGMVSNYEGLTKKINWEDFLKKIIPYLRENEKSFYIKTELRNACKNISFLPNETNMDFHTVPKFQSTNLF